jgi:DNA-binding NarL/FixJ family response regulator
VEVTKAMPSDSVAVIDERAVFRRGVVAILEVEPMLRVVYDAPKGPVPAAADVAVTSPAACARLSGFDGPVVVCGAPVDARPLRAGGRRVAIVERDVHDSRELVAVVRRLAAGRPPTDMDTQVGPCSALPLDARSRHVLRLLADGADTQRISCSLYYSERTVKALIHDIAERLGARTRAEAVAKGIRLGLI